MPVADQHQVNAIIAAAIGECSKAHPELEIGSEEAKQMAKCIIEALTNAGLDIRVHEQS
jgi:hypothetical protein